MCRHSAEPGIDEETTIDCSKRYVSHLILIVQELVQKIIVFVCKHVVCLALSGIATPSATPETVFDGVPRTSLRRNSLVKNIYKKNSITRLSPKCQPSRPILSVAKPETSEDPARFKSIHIPVRHATQPASHSRIPIFVQTRNLRNAIFRDGTLHFFL